MKHKNYNVKFLLESTERELDELMWRCTKDTISSNIFDANQALISRFAVVWLIMYSRKIKDKTI